MNYLAVRECATCNRRTCGFEHLSTDISPRAMHEVHSILENSVRPAIQDSAIAIEVTNFINGLRSRLQRWEPEAPPADNSDLLG